MYLMVQGEKPVVLKAKSEQLQARTSRISLAFQPFDR